MRRATTPTHRFVFDEDPRGFERVLITYAQGGDVVLEKELGDLTDVSQSGGSHQGQRLDEGAQELAVRRND